MFYTFLILSSQPPSVKKFVLKTSWGKEVGGRAAHSLSLRISASVLLKIY